MDTTTPTTTATTRKQTDELGGGGRSITSKMKPIKQKRSLSFMVSRDDASLVPRLPRKSRKDLATGMATLCPRGIQSVTQSRVNVYTRGDDWSCAPLIAAPTVLSLD